MSNQHHNARVLDQFTKQAESYAALVNRSPDTTLPILLDAVKPLPTDCMLDVGCGTGFQDRCIQPLCHSSGFLATLPPSKS